MKILTKKKNTIFDFKILDQNFLDEKRDFFKFKKIIATWKRF